MTTEERLAKSMGVSYTINQIAIGPHRINYLKAGSGPAILLIHGGNVGWGQWYLNIPTLATHFTVYAIDLPGGGRSSRVDYSTLSLESDLVDTVQAFIENLQLSPVTVIGSSVGGWIAVKLAIRNPHFINRLVVIDAVGFTDYTRFSERIIGNKIFAQFLAKTMFVPRRDNPRVEELIRGVFYNRKLSLAPEFVDYFYETMQMSHNILFISRLVRSTGIGRELSLAGIPSSITQPTLAVWGAEDQLIPVAKCEGAIRTIPKVNLEIIEQSGHFPSIEKSDEFNQILIRFLNS